MLAVFPYRELVFTRLEATTRLEKASVVERVDYLSDAEEMIKKNPVFGIGTGNYVRETVLNGRPNNYLNQPVHNAFILLFAESGLFAFIGLILFLSFLARDSRKQTFSLAVVAVMVILMMFDHWLLSLPFGILFFFFILGLI